MKRSATNMPKHYFRIILALLTAATLAGCHGIGASLDNAEGKQGLRFDDDEMRVIDGPEVTIPIWRSGGLKERPKELTLPNGGRAEQTP